MGVRRLKITLVSSCLKPSGGGAPVSEAGLANSLLLRNEVDVVCHGDRVSDLFVERHGLKGRVYKYWFWDVFQMALGEGPLYERIRAADIVHINGHWRWENAFFGAVAKGLGKPYFLHPRGMMAVAHRSILKKRVFNFLLGNRLMKFASGVIGLSRFECRHFEGKPIRHSSVVVVPNGIDARGDSSAANQNSSKGYFLYFGRLEPRKNLLFLIGVFAKYRSAGGGLKLYFMGPAERQYDKVLLAEIVKLGLTDVIQILTADYGARKEDRIRGSVAVIYPAKDEAFGRVPFEAIALGVPAIVPEESGAAEYISPLLAHCIYKTDDSNELARLMSLHEGTPIDHYRMSDARRWLEKELNWDTIARRIEELYNRALDGKEISESNSGVSELQPIGTMVS